jgi:ABC-type multidrug transport system ATPase subunit
MSIICGLIQPSGGAVQVFQFGLPQDIAYVHLLTGVCPQHDVIWGGLTAKEHLEFYGRVKGMPSSELDVEVEQVLKSLGLFKVRDRQAGTFSGGMRRRLSVGMSLMGDPKLILLDEPST